MNTVLVLALFLTILCLPFLSSQEPLIFEDSQFGDENFGDEDFVFGDKEHIRVANHGAKRVRVGESGKYRVVVKNTGPEYCQNITVEQRLPEQLRSQERQTLRWTIPALSPYSEKSFNYSLSSERPGTFEIKTIVSSGDRETTTASFTTTFYKPDLYITQKALYPRIPRRFQATFIIDIVNEKTTEVFDARLVDILPRQLSYVSSEPPGIFAPGIGEEPAKVSWDLGYLAPGDKTTIRLVVKAEERGKFHNVARLTSGAKDYQASAAIRAFDYSASRLSTYDTEDPVEVGMQTTYVIVLSNEGIIPYTNVRIVDEIPERMVFVDASGPTPYTLSGRRVNFEPYPVLEPDERLTYRITCQAIAAGSAKNRAILSYDGFRRDVIDEEGTSIYR